MKPLTRSGGRALCFLGLFFAFLCSLVLSMDGAGLSRSGPLEVTNLSMLRSAITLQSGAICVYDLNGTVLTRSAKSEAIFLHDVSGNAVLEVKTNGIALRPGQKVRLQGTNYVAYTDIGISLGTSPIVDDDNEHSTVERVGEVFLRAGRHPIRAAWFNSAGTYFFQASYSGPQITEQTIPATSLFRRQDWNTAVLRDSGKAFLILIYCRQRKLELWMVSMFQSKRGMTMSLWISRGL